MGVYPGAHRAPGLSTNSQCVDHACRASRTTRVARDVMEFPRNRYRSRLRLWMPTVIRDTHASPGLSIAG